MLGQLKRLLSRSKRRDYSDIDPDSIFIDSKNLPKFNTYQFEGRLERSISPRAFSFFGAACLLVATLFIFKIGSLQIAHGETYKERSENNKLRQILLVAPRGSIYSRDGQKLAWNEQSEEATSTDENSFPSRMYTDAEGFGDLLGFIKYPAKDKSGFYYEENCAPKDGMELSLNDALSRKNGLKFLETSVDGSVVSQSTVKLPEAGKNATLSVDGRIEEKLYKTIKDLAGSVGFQGGASVIMDVNSGEILAMTSFPEYSPRIMTEGSDEEKIKGYSENPSNPFLNRAISGLYTPGSIVKPFMAFAALEEGVITPEKQIVSTGKLVVPNSYNPDQPSIFKDWKAHGAVDMRRAIAVSSDVYFYEIGGGFGNQKGLGIDNIKKYMLKFGFTQKTGFNLDKEAEGLIPDPEWKAKTFNGDIWRVGDTYNTTIGQYGVQITPIQAVRAVAAIANGGKLVTPSIFFTSTSTVSSGKMVGGSPENYQVVREGMRASVAEGGTASGLNTSAVHIAGKTGTAELGARKQFVNSWVIGFFPYEHPKYAFVTVMEKGPVTNLLGATYVMRQLFDWMAINTPEYFEEGS